MKDRRAGGKKPKGPSRPESPMGTLGSIAPKELREAARASRSSAASPIPRPPPPPPAPTAPRRVTQDELMREAFAAVGVKTDRASKLTGEGYDAGEIELIEPPCVPIDGALPAGEQGPEPPMTQEERLFADAMGGGVRPLSQAPRLAEKQWAGSRWHDEVQRSRVDTADLAAIEKTSAHRELLRQAGQVGEIAELNIRHLRRREAMEEVVSFVTSWCRAGARFVRIVTGKGRHSEGEPVLKRAVIEWCEAEGQPFVRGWAPEADRAGQYGAVVLQLASSAKG